MTNTKQRLNRLLAEHGIGSRRAVDQMISAGRVLVNDRVAELGMRVNIRDRITVDGAPLQRQVAGDVQVLLLNKPVGFVCSRVAERGAPSVYTLLPPLSSGRWISVGRLDINSEGLLLFTNDGHLADRLMHPRSGLKRRYLVRGLGDIDEATKKRMLKGIDCDGERLRLASIQERPKSDNDTANRWFDVVLIAGRRREIRRLFDAVGVQVNRLLRIGYGPVQLPRELRIGQSRLLTETEQQHLLSSIPT